MRSSPFSRAQSSSRSRWVRRLVLLGSVGVVTVAMLLGNSPTVLAYSISNTNEIVTTTGGGVYIGPVVCPTGSAIYSIDANVSGNALTRPVSRCANLNDQATAITTWTADLGGTGWGSDAGTALTETSCASNQALTGLAVHKQLNGFVAGWQVICGTLPSGSARTTNATVFGYQTSGGYAVETIQCPVGMIAVGMVGYVGGILDRIGLRCGTVTGATQATVTMTSSSAINFGSTLALTSSGGTAGSTSYSTTGGCTVSGSTLTATGNAGTSCSVTATRAGDTNYATATSSTQSVTIQKVSNTISFTNPGTRTWSATPFAVAPTATSGVIPVISSSTTSVCTTSGMNVTMVTSGSCTIVASEAGNTNYNAASNVTQSFTISPTGRTGFTGNSGSISGTTTGSKYVVESFTTTGSSTWTVP